MRSSDFPAAVEPRMATGGALSSGANTIGHDVKIAADTVVDIIKKLRGVPGIDMAAFDHGAQMMLQGLHTIASAMKRQ